MKRWHMVALQENLTPHIQIFTSNIAPHSKGMTFTQTQCCEATPKQEGITKNSDFPLTHTRARFLFFNCR